MLRIALAGNPNSGKTTLFNRLTGSNAHVGNWPGVTVEHREGKYKSRVGNIQIIDLPGIYSTSPYSPEEVISRNYIMDEKPDVIIDVIDVTNMERSLYLATEFIETDTPVVLALNMMDEAKKNGYIVNPEILTKKLGVPAVPVSAAKGTGVEELMEAAIKAAGEDRAAGSVLAGSGIYPGVTAIRDVIKSNYNDNTLYRAVKLLENDSLMMKELDGGTANKVNKARRQVEAHAASGDIQAEIADLRYKYITENCGRAVIKPVSPSGLSRSDKIDLILTNRFLGIPIFILILGTVFFLTFGELASGGIPMPGVWLQGIMEGFIGSISSGIGGLLENVGAAGWTKSLIADGIVGGIGGVLSFLPQILLMFLFISILEGTGYMARAAFIMDRLLRRFGLSGKAFVPLLMGFGCSVPAVMASRTIENEKERRLTIMLTPFMSCGAKLPIYSLFAGVFFRDYSFLGISGSVWAIFGVYFTGVAVAVISGTVLKGTLLKGGQTPFIMELPSYRLPALKTLVLNLWEKLKHFIFRAGTVILLASIAVWLLESFDFSFNMTPSSAESILGVIGKAIAPVFAPLGFGYWQAAVAILTGFIAKEAVVSTLGVLYSGTPDIPLAEGAASAAATAVAAAFSPLSAFSFMIFNLLAPPCVTAMATIGQEMRSKKWTGFALVFQLAAAWIMAFLIYSIGSVFIR